MSILTLLPDYVEYLKHERQLSESTIVAYVNDLQMMARSLPQSIDQISLDELRWYQRHLSITGLKVTTIRRKFHGFSTFWRWARMEGHCDEIITERITLPKQQIKIPRWLSIDELTRFVTTPAPGRSEFVRLRNRLAFRTLAWLGIRRSEMLNLQINNVVLHTNVVIIRNTKSKRDRSLPLPAQLKPDFDLLMENRPGDDYVFGSTPGQPWGVQPFSRAFKKHLRACGLADQDITPHTLRHTFATHLVMRGVPITEVKELLGHSDIKNTMIYVHIDTDRLRRAMSLHVLNGVA